MPGLDLSLLKAMPGGLSPAWDSRGFLIGEIDWFDGDHPILGQAFVFGMSTKIDREGGSKNRVAGFEAGHLSADGLNFPGQFHAEDVTPGLVPPQDQACHEFLPASDIGQFEIDGMPYP
jgi:hypothetical protein